MPNDHADIDPIESQEWQDAIADVIERDGANRAHYLLDRAVQQARAAGASLPFSATTPYQNTIPVDDQADFPGDLEMEWRIRTINRWNAMATVVRRNKVSSEYGGHIASFASGATLMYDVGLQSFFSCPHQSDIHGGDLVFYPGTRPIAGNLCPRLSWKVGSAKHQLYRLPLRKSRTATACLPIPIPGSCPDFWQFPDRVHGTGADHGHLPSADSCATCRTGACSTPKSARYGRLHGRRRDGRAGGPGCHLPGSAGKTWTIWFSSINCNLQRLDGPVRGNSQYHVQELEGGLSRCRLGG